MALMLDQIPDPGFGEESGALMATAVEPAVSSPRVVLSLPTVSLDHFRTLDATLDAAVELSDVGELLTPPTQPEIRAFRRWLCAEVAAQGRGEEPTPWSRSREAAPVVARTPLEWSPERVSQSTSALIAADDTNRIVAISGAALDLLGYDGADELVGKRLVTIIPERFHQAHVAGFTLHLYTGRAPLLGTPVTVPVLRRDDTEVMMELLVESEQLPGGRHVFVAALSA